MRRLLFLFAAVTGLCFTSCNGSEEAVYFMQDSFVEYYLASTGGPGSVIQDAFMKEVIAWDAKNEVDWEWSELSKNGSFDKPDAAAKEKFDRYASELQAIYEKYQAQFDACEDPDFKYFYTGALELKRFGTETRQLGYKEFTVRYNY